MQYIYAAFDENQNIAFGLKNVEEKFIAGSEYSSLLNLLNPVCERIEY